MTNSIFLDTLNGIKRERPPVWFMRQAGRVIPQYLQLREKYSFKELMNTPELAAEVTLQPVHLLGVDAAILFSDILVIPEAMGMNLEFTDKGPRFDHPLKSMKDPLTALSPDPEKLQPVYNAIDAIIASKPKDIPLIGFCGAPLTTFLYMVQGLSSNHTFPDAIDFIYRNRELTEKIFDAITDLSIEYALSQIKHGVSAFQLFDTHAGLIPVSLYQELVMPRVRKMMKAIKNTGTATIFLPKGLGIGLKDLTPEDADFVSIDWHIPITEARKTLHPQIGVQGNLDPRILTADQATIKAELEKYREFGKENYNWIFNLGHGLIPSIPFENVKFVVDWVKSTDWGREID